MDHELGDETYIDVLLVCSALSPPKFTLIGNDDFITNLVWIIPVTVETRCSKVIFPNYSKKKPAEDTLVPPPWGTREEKLFF